MKRKITYPINKLGRRIHYCGEGYKGEVIKAKGLVFCGFCGKEFRK
ncbi:MAG TPA: hypothetical protein VJB90_00030 [Candidatus Nanoarchaeia archaeon]|nr:hypothetical protein [Candidatus Nanoarchaeia archaeon]